MARDIIISFAWTTPVLVERLGAAWLLGARLDSPTRAKWAHRLGKRLFSVHSTLKKVSWGKHDLGYKRLLPHSTPHTDPCGVPDKEGVRAVLLGSEGAS